MPKLAEVRGPKDDKGSKAKDLRPLDVVPATEQTGEKESGGDEDTGATRHSYRDASYVSPGPFPFTCGTCSYRDGYDCALVEGPYNGQISPNDTCRFYKPKPQTWGDK